MKSPAKKGEKKLKRLVQRNKRNEATEDVSTKGK